MTDIVERLRERLRGNFADDDDELDAEAADEIERLRAEVERLQVDNGKLRDAVMTDYPASRIK